MTEQQQEPVDRKRRMTQRLVGAAVLAALAAIIIPAILDFRADQGTTITGTNIPDRTDGFRIEEITLTPQRGFRESEPADSPEPPAPPAPEAAPAPEPVPETPVIERAADSQGWAVQVGSFSSEENATALRDRLRGAGFSAFLDQATIDGRAVVRVLVGPDARREHSETLRDRLAAEMDLGGVVIGYE